MRRRDIPHSPYNIYHLEDLIKLRNEVNSGDNKLGKKYQLMNDIDMSLISNWTPIGIGGGIEFHGSFNGNFYKISNMKRPSGTTGGGLFGYCNKGTFENIIFENCTVQISSNGAAIVAALFETQCTVKKIMVLNGTVAGLGYCGGIAGQCTGNISECCFIGTSVKANANSGAGCGGITGFMHTGSMTNCFFKGTIGGSQGFFGGLVGDYLLKTGTITKNYTMAGDITVTSPSMVGGIIGRTASGLGVGSNVDLFEKISYSAGYRISPSSCLFSNNYALDTMIVGSSTISTGTSTNGHGQNVTQPTALTQSFWQTTMGFDFTNIWKMSNSSGSYGGYPIFKWMTDN